jgi:hypothetical protein
MSPSPFYLIRGFGIIERQPEKGMTMRQFLVNTGTALVGVLLFAVGSAQGQTPFEEAMQQLSSDNARGYLQPFVDGFGSNLNSGLMRPVNMTSLGFTMKVEVVAVGTLIGEEQKTYRAVAPDPYDQTPVETATVFGGPGTVVSGPGGLQYQFQNGQLNTRLMPMAIPQATLGTVFGTEAVVRYAAIPKMENFPHVDLVGVGLRHNISQYFPGFPVDLAAGVFYQKLTVGDLFDAHTTNLSLQASTSLAIFRLYGGAQYETSDLSLHYAYTGPGSTPESVVRLDMSGGNRMRATAGLGLDLVVLHLNTDISVGRVTSVSAGVGFGF